jgi:hypothetical protein
LSVGADAVRQILEPVSVSDWRGYAVRIACIRQPADPRRPGGGRDCRRARQALCDRLGSSARGRVGHDRAKGEGRTLLTDGPFIETKEFLVGVIVVEADNLDAALAIAQELQDTRTSGAIEVRPILEALFHGA